MPEESFSELHAPLLRWWTANKRVFPWRETTEPYHIFIAEVLLHRTRAEQVVRLYRDTLNAFPTINALANAESNSLSTILHSAGLRWRVTLLLRAAEVICQKYGGEIPSDKEELEAIPGIGHYIASAIRCFAFGQPDALIDTNTVRVLTRVYGLEANDRTRRDPTFHKLANDAVDSEHPKEYNLAMLDLAAAICTPRNPRCPTCPILSHCIYGRALLGH
jgi:A/G-specific adenine glycosylase